MGGHARSWEVTGGRGSKSASREPFRIRLFFPTYEILELLERPRQQSFENERIGQRRRGWVDDEDDTPLRLPLLERRRPV